MKKQGLGLKLQKLHSSNAWIILFLAISGILLYLPPMRALLGEGRVWLKQLHIAAGLVSLALIIIYLPYIRKHIRLLTARKAQQGNLMLVLVLLAGWIMSGLVLWRYRSFPPAWNNSALLVHDLLTWVGIPYAVYHSVTRSRWLRKVGREVGRNQHLPLGKPVEVMEIGMFEPTTGRIFRHISRRSFIKTGVAAVVTAVAMPLFIRWMNSAVGSSNLSSLQEEESAYADFLQPTPLSDSLPPKGGGAKGSFRIYTVTDIPKFDPDKWTFTVDGLVNRPFQWSWTEFLAFPRQVQVSDFHCVTGWSVNSCTWEGIPLNKLLEQAGVKEGVKMVKFYSADGEYTDNITIEQTWMEDVMVVVMLDGKPIPRDMGGPVRLVVPQMYAYKSVKWLNRIELIDSDHTGYWEQRGYAKDAWIWVPPM
ncbi:Protein-methionine-sulfoxide reductase catalytic subunit MsrP [Paenibacillus allorhizoplanae]|uniref:Protein-methionine-sulfoxide reductase catalytic subunit MsrP n=1 Tax=Paenibacillus allorhizoplanae TaxID=2905648 RepID=A0ABM9C4L2_9BACL|nr:molybdopterin-dependent oxidoreductase [Paenibacillus allorhizoplanae]CAH1202213.1 Protein-methionine-sulfoxide reductase catalytic subunit MsrP [Paenibacillus allorhizoplanae]